MATPSNHTSHAPKRPEYIEGVGWRYPIEHRMTRWPRWKDSRKPGTYMFTLGINGGQKVLGSLAGTTAAIYRWMKAHPAAVKAASNDMLYYRHALLGNRAMPFVHHNAAVYSANYNTAVKTAAHEDITTPPTCDGVSTPSNAKPRTHFPLEALSQPDAPHIVLTPFGEKVKASLERMHQVEPKVELICYAIMPNHIHIILAVKEQLKRPIGSIMRSFMGTTSRILHKELTDGNIKWDKSVATITNKASEDKPSLWQEKYCVGICHTSLNLHTRIGYVLENPFFGVLESERRGFMERTLQLNIAGRDYCAYGNILLLKEPDRMQVFCHSKHPVTQEPYHLTQDFMKEKETVLEASANGVVIVTPGISPGEASIMWEVLRSGGNVINIQKKEIPTSDKWHPEKERRIYCSQGRMLVLSVKDLPRQTFHDRRGYEIPMNTAYAKFHLLNFVAEEICREGIEHECILKTAV